MTSATITDSLTMFRRDLLHLRRFPVMTISQTAVPAFMLVLFLYVLGGAVSGTAVGTAAGHGRYVDYLVPGLLVMGVGGISSTTSINVNTDMAENIVARLRTMPITRASVLTGQVLGSVLRTAISLVLLVAVALLAGFRPTASPLAWLGAAGLLLLLTLAMTWVGVGAGLVASNPGAANSIGLPAQLLPFLSSAFVPTQSMSPGVRWFAENQPFTPIIDTLRHLLAGTAVGSTGLVAVGWCLLIAGIGYGWSRWAYAREPIR